MKTYKIHLLLFVLCIGQFCFAQVRLRTDITGNGLLSNAPIQPGSTHTYKATCDPAKDYNYVWSPTGGTIIGGTTLSTVTVKWDSNISTGTILVKISGNGIEDVGTFQKTVYFDYNKPRFTENPSSIPFGSSSTYRFSVSSISGASYSWTIPNGWTLVSGQNSNSIQLKHNVQSLNRSHIEVSISKNGELLETLGCPYQGITGCSYYIDGANTVYYASPETYTLKGSAMPSGYTVLWTKGDFALVSGGNGTSITVGKALAEGEQQITAELKTQYASYIATKTVVANPNRKPGTFSVYPTSVTSDVTIKSEDNVPLKSIKIVSISGDLVKAQQFGNNQTEATFNLSSCRNGIYYMQVETGTETRTVKIIKK